MAIFDTPQPITATVEISAGTIHVAATDRSDTVVEVRPRDESRSHDVKAAEQVRTDFRDGRLVVASPRGFALPRRGAVVIDIALPSGSHFSAAVSSATVTADGEYGDCTFASASGNLTVGAVSGNLKADTASGDVRATSATSATVSTASGDVRLAELGGDIKFRAASGSLSVGRLQGNLNAQTASGDVAVTAAVRGSISAQTSSGEVTVGVAEGTAAQLDLRTNSGSVRSTLKPSDGPAEGDETIVVQARTASGDVIVQRAVGPAAA